MSESWDSPTTRVDVKHVQTHLWRRWKFRKLVNYLATVDEFFSLGVFFYGSRFILTERTSSESEKI